MPKRLTGYDYGRLIRILILAVIVGLGVVYCAISVLVLIAETGVFDASDIQVAIDSACGSKKVVIDLRYYRTDIVESSAYESPEVYCSSWGLGWECECNP